MGFPAIHTCLICEYARVDNNAPPIIVGLYGSAPYIRIPPLNHALLTFVMLSEPVTQEGTFDFTFQVFDGTEKVLAAGSMKLTTSNKQRGLVNIVIALQGVTMAPGKYSIRLML